MLETCSFILTGNWKFQVTYLQLEVKINETETEKAVLAMHAVPRRFSLWV